MLLPCAADGANAVGAAPAAAALSDPAAVLHAVSVRLCHVTRLSAARLWLPAELRSARDRHVALEAMRQLLMASRLGGADEACRGGGGSERLERACLHPTRDLGAGDVAVCAEAVAEAEALRVREDAALGSLAGAEGGGAEGAAAESPEARLERAGRVRALEEQAAAIGAEEAALTTDEFSDEMVRMRRVLRRLGHIDGANVVQLKGRAAAEVEAADELLVAEMLLGGAFAELSAAAAVSLCSCFIAADAEKVKKPPDLHADLAPSHAALVGAARALAAVLADAGIETDADEFAGRFDSGLMNVVYAWCNGARFDELCSMVELFEGSIVRAIRRLSELLDELQSAAKAIGNDELYAKLGEGAKLIRRDIVFAGSLYIEG